METDMKPFRFRYDEHLILDKVGQAEGICSNANFVFDQPLTITPKDVLELNNGQLFLIADWFGSEYKLLLAGKWDR